MCESLVQRVQAEMADKEQGQQVLDLFRVAFQDTLEGGNELQKRIQAVKGALYDRNYVEAFGSQENLDAYVVRWSPSRALAYADLLRNLGPVRSLLTRMGQNANVLCIGGGAGAEVVALGSIALLDQGRANTRVTAVDVASWDLVIDKIVHYVAQNWYMDRCRSEGQEPSLDELLERMRIGDSAQFGVRFINHDILTLPPDALDFAGLDLITSMFTTNELFTSSRVETVRLLQRLSACKPGCLLLLVESAGSYSEVKVGSRVFPVQFLIDHTLTSRSHWKLLDSSDSKWYRVPEGLDYPMRLENMRYFFRLYQRTDVQ